MCFLVYNWIKVWTQCKIHWYINTKTILFFNRFLSMWNEKKNFYGTFPVAISTPSNEDANLFVFKLSSFHYRVYISRVCRRRLPAMTTTSRQAEHLQPVKLKKTLPSNILRTKIGPLSQIKILTVNHLLQLNQFLQIFYTFWIIIQF